MLIMQSLGKSLHQLRLHNRFIAVQPNCQIGNTWIVPLQNFDRIIDNVHLASAMIEIKENRVREWTWIDLNE